MASHSVPHLVRRADTFYFRRALPLSVARQAGFAELKISLKTTDAKLAKIRCREFSNLFERVFGELQGMANIKPETIKQLVSEFFINEWRSNNDTYYMVTNDPSLDLADEANGTDALIDKIRAEAGTGQFSRGTRTEADGLLERHQVSIKPGTDEYAELCRGVARARIQALRIFTLKLRGMFEKAVPDDPLFLDIADPGLPPLPDENTSAAVGKTLRQAITAYVEHIRLQKQAEKTIDEKIRVLEWLPELLGGDNRQLLTITRDDIRQVRDVIQRLPHGFTVRKEYKGMKLKELAALDKVKRIDTATAIKNLNAVKTLFKWAENDGWFGNRESPAEKVSIKAIKKAPSEKRQPFSIEQLRALLASPLYSGCRSEGRRAEHGKLMLRDDKFWVPLVGLYTGMRLGEIIQLGVEDVKQTDGHWYIDINRGENDETDEDGDSKSLKNWASVRKIPLHPMLISLGWLDYIAIAREANPKGRIFSSIKKGSNGAYSHNFSKWFGRYITATKIKTKRTAFHSFRHGMADALRAADAEDSVLKSILGHSDGTATGDYGVGHVIKKLEPIMAKVDYELDFNHLLPKP